MSYLPFLVLFIPAVRKFRTVVSALGFLVGFVLLCLTWEIVSQNQAIANVSMQDGLGTFATLAACETALNTYVSAMSTNERQNISIAFSAASGVFGSNSYLGSIVKSSSSRAQVVFQRNNSPELVVGISNSGVWTWDSPSQDITDQFHGLKFNPLGSYTGTVHEINIPSGSRHFIMQISTSGGNSGYAAMIAVTNSGTIVNSDFFKGTNVTMTKSQNTLTLTYESETSSYFYDFVLSGNACSRPT